MSHVMMSTISFERYNDELTSLTEQVEESLQGDLNEMKLASSLLGKCDDILKQMAVEARGFEGVSSKRNLLDKVKTSKTQLQNLKDKHKQVSRKIDREALELAKPNTSNGRGNNRNAHKERLPQMQESLNKQNESLENARRIMADTEETAFEIISELGHNRETLESASGRVQEASGLTNRARSILQSMTRFSWR